MSGRIGCRDLRVVARGRELLHVPALDVAAGEALAVLGPNGAGKSTLLRALGHLGGLRSSGEVLLDGRPAGPRELRPAVAAVLQRPILQRGSVAANGAAGLRMRGVGRAEARERSAPWLDALGVGHLADRNARTLSGGEAQRVALARALAPEPRVLLLDEPFAGLDATTRADLLADLRAVLDGLDTAVLLVTHDRYEAAALAGTTALLVDGRIRQLGPTARVLDEPADVDCARLVGFTNVLPAAVTGRAGLLVARPEHCRAVRDGDGDVRVPGTVRRVVRLGGPTRVDVDTAAGTLACLAPGDGDLTAGAAAAVVVEESQLRTIHSPTSGTLVG
ncbi:ABC transporter ATP-binding protein [Pseudonocardia kunmingensis]|uniref:Thiamine transport system ATP-binding protein/tungstate transport system ATP-binding protein n=1 Tax=Pseudonocardia kunmingensis TaxID=630975 RepID=A0A543DWR0_9PSEU|nr:ABC transporter ATP-binding protein [Pseudonocardia kunmingensis]TQM13736.1 thiamine transport system ATP-binding protein/tungstate transport system ATP-binding protein [Pseudonocardia kunmingensis]